MNRTTILQLLTEHKKELAQRFGVASQALFGSFVREAERIAVPQPILMMHDSVFSILEMRISDVRCFSIACVGAERT